MVSENMSLTLAYVLSGYMIGWPMHSPLELGFEISRFTLATSVVIGSDSDSGSGSAELRGR